MKICIFSDIHGNGPAFFSAYSKILAENADLNIFLGDLCGYYYDQIKILSALFKIPNLISIKGNHEHMYLKIASGSQGLLSEYTLKYGHSMKNLCEHDNGDLVKWSAALSYSYHDPEGRFSCFHGSPTDHIEGYVYPDSPLEDFNHVLEPFVFLGHTHYKMKRCYGSTKFINPGSLGQPRGGGWPTYALVDVSSGIVDFREVKYNKDELIKKIDNMGDNNHYLKRILI